MLCRPRPALCPQENAPRGLNTLEKVFLSRSKRSQRAACQPCFLPPFVTSLQGERHEGLFAWLAAGRATPLDFSLPTSWRAAGTLDITILVLATLYVGLAALQGSVCGAVRC